MSNSKCQLFEDIYNTVYDDGYMWLVIWGPARTAKTTLAGWILYSLYKDWHKTLDAFGYNLSQILYKMQHGIPERWPTKNGLHNRVPVLNWDDFGAHSNKAVTQYDPAWDAFKGGFDILGTKIGVLIATMVDPTEPTAQIAGKYTHEVEILQRGVYKYDRVDWQQDFKGWRPRVKKRHVETNTFDPWPIEVYKEYDEVRTELADEVFQKIEDAQAEGSIPFLLKLCKPIDYQILSLIEEKGPLYYRTFPETADAKKALVRLKARQLMVPVRGEDKSYVRYDITPLGLSVLRAHSQEAEQKITETQKPQVAIV